MVKKDKHKLKEYQEKRKFQKTGEPKSNTRKGKGDEPIFVIQKHQASNLHYDFRLEIDDVLVSWAVPKGPSTNPKVKRLAMQVEDHPLAYADFEGVIPEGEYGAGQVMVWDRGTYQNKRRSKENDQADMTEALDQGKIEIWLKGKKLKGGYNLIRTGKKGDKNQWLLMKADDSEADARRNPTSTESKSVQTNRTLQEIQKDNEEEKQND